MCKWDSGWASLPHSAIYGDAKGAKGMNVKNNSLCGRSNCEVAGNSGHENGCRQSSGKHAMYGSTHVGRQRGCVANHAPIAQCGWESKGIQQARHIRSKGRSSRNPVPWIRGYSENIRKSCYTSMVGMEKRVSETTLWMSYCIVY